jgi:hypothetical protein
VTASAGRRPNLLGIPVKKAVENFRLLAYLLITPPAAWLPGARRAKARRCSFGTAFWTRHIDGFNLYYGLLKGTAFKWLDLERFCDQLLPKNSVKKIYYFTAKVDAATGSRPARASASLSQRLGNPSSC